MLLFWPVFIPFFTAVLTLLAWRSAEMQRGISAAGAFALLAVTATVFSEVATNGPVAAQAGGWTAPYGITFVADMFSAVLVLLTGLISVSVILYGFVAVGREEEHFGYHPLLHGLLAGVCGSFLTGDLFNMYVWFEVILICSFGLLVTGGGRAQVDGAVKYVGLNLIATLAFIAGVGLLYGTTGALNMADLHGKLLGRGSEAAVLGSAAFLLFAMGSKAALFPVFFWLPASYHTPSFSTSTLFAALLTKVGVYAIFRVCTLVFDIEGTPIALMLILVGVFTMVFGILGALSQNSVRRVLGYTIISSIGAMILGLGVGTPEAISGAVFYLFQDIPVKAALFMMAGVVFWLTGSELFARAGGIWRAHPALSLLFLIPALSLAGVPPLSGFWAKLLLVKALLDVDRLLLAVIVLITGLLTLFAMGRIWSAVFWSPHTEGETAIRPHAAGVALVPVTALVLLVIWIGLDAGTYIDLTTTVAGQLTDPSAYISAVMGEGQ